MRRWRRLAITAGMSLVVTLAAVPAAAAEVREGNVDDSAEILSAYPLCSIGGTRVVTGNWDGIGGDGIGIVVPDHNANVLWWYLRDAANPGPANYVFSYGEAGDRPVTGNWDGIGGDGPGIVRPIQVFEDGAWRWNWQWHLRNGNSAGGIADYTFTYGRQSYPPVVGNWDGVGGDGPGVAGGDANGFKAWHLRNHHSGGNADYNFTYGLTGVSGYSDLPIAGNWDGAGGDGPGVLRGLGNGTIDWHLRNGLSAGGANHIINYGGSATDCAVVGNWDGVSGDGIGVVRFNAQTGKLQWHLRNNPTLQGGPDAVFDYS